jgi:hypothetical protein
MQSRLILLLLTVFDSFDMAMPHVRLWRLGSGRYDIHRCCDSGKVVIRRVLELTADHFLFVLFFESFDSLAAVFAEHSFEISHTI